MDKFSKWLDDQLKKREWTQAELSRASGLDSAVVSNLINGRRNPGPDTAKAIARGFGLPPEMVLRAAGLLPGLDKDDPLTQEGIHILRELEPTEKEDAVRYLRLRRQVQEERGKYNARKRKERPAGA